MLFGWLNKNDNYVFAPATGKTVDLKDVPDAVFSKKMMGDGIAFVFEGNTIYSPCNGKIMFVADSRHAFGIKMNNGAEILVHIGLDLVNLNGKGLISLVKEGTKVNYGSPIIKLDDKVLNDKNLNLLSMIVITNCTEYNYSVIEKNIAITKGFTKLISFK